MTSETPYKIALYVADIRCGQLTTNTLQLSIENSGIQTTAYVGERATQELNKIIDRDSKSVTDFLSWPILEDMKGQRLLITAVMQSDNPNILDDENTYTDDSILAESITNFIRKGKMTTTVVAPI